MRGLLLIVAIFDYWWMLQINSKYMEKFSFD